MGIRRVGFITDNDVFLVINIDDELVPFVDGIIAGLGSSPDVADVTDNLDINGMFTMDLTPTEGVSQWQPN